jgi:rare lipoprotein A (peptidoglycan hydrolase)
MPRLLSSFCALLPLLTWSPWSVARAEQPTFGLASFYGATPTPSEKFTAAHRTLPIGTIVAVTRVDNGAQVVVRINDRGPFLRGRIIDLCKRAAEQLGMIGQGVARVRIQVVPAELLTVRAAGKLEPAADCLACLQAPIFD